MSVMALAVPAAPVMAADWFPEPVYVSLRESQQVVRFPGQRIWEGGPKMLYTSVTPDGKTLVVSSPKSGGLFLFDTANGQRQGPVATGKAAKGVKITPDGQQAWVSNEGANSISVVDLAGRTTIATFETEKMPHNIRFTRDGRTGYVTLQGGAGLGVIDVAARRISRVIPTPGIETPHNLDLSQDEKRAFIRDASNQVGVLDLVTGKMIRVIKVGEGHAGIDVIPNGRLVFTGAIADEVVTVIDAHTLEVVKKIPVGFGPHGVRASRDNRYLYVAVTAADRVVVIDIDKLEVVHHYDTPGFPFWIAVQGNP